MNKINQLFKILHEMTQEELSLIAEMANVTNNQHRLGINLKFHVQQPGDRLPPHFVNTKVFRGDFKTTNMKFTVSIPDLKIIDGNAKWLSLKDLKVVMQFIKNNTDNFISLFKDQGLSPDEIKWRNA